MMYYLLINLVGGSWGKLRDRPVGLDDVVHFADVHGLLPPSQAAGQVGVDLHYDLLGLLANRPAKGTGNAEITHFS